MEQMNFLPEKELNRIFAVRDKVMNLQKWYEKHPEKDIRPYVGAAKFSEIISCAVANFEEILCWCEYKTEE